MRTTLALLATGLLAACMTPADSPPGYPTSNVGFFGKPAAVDQASRTGTRHALQSFTPAMAPTQPLHALRTHWTARVGKTDSQTTMAFVDGMVIVGSHGNSFDAKDEPQDGVYLLDGKTGQVVRMIATPGRGDRDVNGFAVESSRIYFTTDNGLVVAATFEGAVLWTAPMQGPVAAAPALADFDGDGKIDVVAGDSSGALVAFDGQTGKAIWRRTLGVDAAKNGVAATPAVFDVDGDGRPDVIAGDGAGVLGAYRGRDGTTLWTHVEASRASVAPSVTDVNADGRAEVVAAWENATVALLDAKTGALRWETTVEEDNGATDGLLGSPLPLPGLRAGTLVVPTARWGAPDGVVVLAQHLRAFRSHEGRIAGSGVAMKLDPSNPPYAIFGAATGDVFGVDALGHEMYLAHVGGPVEASIMIADVDGDGTLELLIPSSDGSLTCMDTQIADKPFVSRFRGDSLRNTGELPAVDLGWRLAEGAKVAFH